MTTKARILIAENDGIIDRDIEKILERFGYSVSDTAFSGEEALKKVGESRPDLLLSEISLEGEMDGIEAAGRIYDQFNIPVIFVTAVSDNNTIERAKR